jgi:hypothetical protein
MSAALLAGLLAAGASIPRFQTLAVAMQARTPSLTEAVLDLALADDDRIVVLSPEAVSLYRWGGDGLVLASRRLLAGAAPVRTPGGLLTPLDESGAFWALTSRATEATLYRIEGGQLQEVARADALPWAGCAEGLRFQPGTNLIQGRVASLGAGPFLTLEPGVAVDASGRLRAAEVETEEPGPRVGPTLAALGDSLLAASRADPPGSTDAILLLSRGDAGWEVRQTLPVEGAVRALAARPRSGRWRLVAALEEAEPERATHLVVLELAPQEP